MRSYGQFCGLARALDRVGQRWALLIVRELLLGPKRFTDLRAGLPGVATNLLTERLRQLQEEGLVWQRELPPPSSSTVYELTEAGEGLRPVVEALIRWGGRWMVAGPGDDVFRGGWLALALESLGAGAALEEAHVIRFESGSGATTLSLGGGRVSVAGPDVDPELVVRGDPALVLGLAAGAVAAVDAAAGLNLEPNDHDGAALLARTLSPAGAGGAGGQARSAVVEGPIRWRLHVPAPPERVHEALSTNEGRRGFWADTLTSPDGAIRYRFLNGVEYEGRVVESRAPSVFAVEYFGGVARFELTPDGNGGTDLELTHTGLWGEEWIETHAGWLNVLLPLKAMVGHGVELRNRDPRRSWDDGYVDG
jgi:DNA-binding HxlR family transcriptional regulator/uncharacterized protein YndB with AHSA1/START domain